MSLECSECEHDLRGGHAEDCSRRQRVKGANVSEGVEISKQTKKGAVMDLSALGITREELIDRIVEKVANDLMGDEERLGVRVRDVINTKVDKAVALALTAAMPARVDAVFEKALSVEYTPINIWGEPTGAPRSIREVMLERAAQYMEQPVNEVGNPISTNSYGPKGVTRLQYYAGVAVKEAMNKETFVVLEQMKAEYSKKLREAVGVALASLIQSQVK